jgi:serpin B
MDRVPRPLLTRVSLLLGRPISEEEAAWVAARDINGFALELYGALNRPRTNLFFSPLSIRVALAMLHAGAKRETADELQAVLGRSLPGARLHDSFSATMRRFTCPADGDYELAIANSLWAQAGTPIVASFADSMTRYYGAAADRVDFRRDPQGARATINDWVSKHTNHRIRDMLQPPQPTSDTRFVLANAIYFKGRWQNPFEPKETSVAPFYLENGAQVRAHLMQQVADVGYRAGRGYQAVTLAYRNAALAMLVLLPDRGDGLPKLESALSPSMIGDLLQLRSTTEAEVFLPRFRTSWGEDLVGPLQTLGIRRAFTPEADFSGINGRAPPDEDALWVSLVLHKAYAEVNEEGTEAAAATLDTALFLGIRPRPPRPVFRADHPFLFAIGDTSSGAVLFLGRVLDPTRET